MIRRIICPVLKLTLRIFFRRIEVSGIERVPLDSPAIFVLNHPNALVDPVFLLCLVPRTVSFLAKAPLFNMPILGYFIRALDSLPVYRKQDEADTSRNLETFERARELLSRGGTIAICPEGASHSEPRLKPLKTGAARIALGAASSGGSLNLQIVPAGLYYTAKTTFRSSALLHFGEPIRVEPVELDEGGEVPHEEVRALSKRIERALRDVVLDAEHEEALSLISRAEKIFSSAEESTDERRLERELDLRRRFVEGYASLLKRSPEKLSALAARLTRFEEELRQAGLEADDLTMPSRSSPEVVFDLLSRTIIFGLLSPLALCYRLKGRSLIVTERVELLMIIVVSVACWWLFEFYNSPRFWKSDLELWWHYHNLVPNPYLRRVGYDWAFATIFPALFETAEVFKTSLFRRARNSSPLKFSRAYLLILIALGAFAAILPLIIISQWLVPLVWLSFIFLLDPINYLRGKPSITGDLAHGNHTRLISLLLSGFVCGVLWEFWNFWAVSKWTYTVPYLGDVKIFEMPVLGFLGFPPFAVECWAMYIFLRSLLTSRERDEDSDEIIPI